MPFQQIIMQDFFRRSLLMGVPLCVQRPGSKSTFSTNYHACIALPTWHRCAPPILFWPWPPYNLFPRSCLTWIFSVEFYWWVQLCVHHPAKSMPFQQISMQDFFRCTLLIGVPLCVQRPAKAPFQQIIMHALHYQHDIDVHLLFCFDLDLHITSSRGHV